MKRVLVSARLSAGGEGFSGLAALVRGACSRLHFAEDAENRALLVAGECFENIARHGGGNGCALPLRVLLRGIPGSLRVDLLYRPQGAAGCRKARRAAAAGLRRRTDTAGTSAGEKPSRDGISGRWRGMGLLLCRRLAARMDYGSGLFRSRISFWISSGNAAAADAENGACMRVCGK